MIGMPGAEVSNMAPPDLALAAVGQIGLAMLLRDRIVASASSGAVARVLVLGLDTPQPFTTAWVAGWPLWLATLALLLRPLLR
jgi:hypothetical protein